MKKRLGWILSAIAYGISIWFYINQNKQGGTLMICLAPGFAIINVIYNKYCGEPAPIKSYISYTLLFLGVNALAMGMIVWGMVAIMIGILLIMAVIKNISK